MTLPFKFRYLDAMDEAGFLQPKKLRHDHLVLLLKMLRHVNDEGLCYPSPETISTSIGVSRASVHRFRKQLIELNLLARESTGGGCGADGRPKLTVWRLVLPTVSKTPPFETVGTVSNQGGVLSQKGGEDCLKNPAFCDRNHSYEPNINHHVDGGEVSAALFAAGLRPRSACERWERERGAEGCRQRIALMMARPKPRPGQRDNQGAYLRTLLEKDDVDLPPAPRPPISEKQICESRKREALQQAKLHERIYGKAAGGGT